MFTMLKVGIFFAAVVCMTTADYLQGLQEIKEALPGVVEGSPELLKISFDSGVSVDMGNELTPTQTKNQPTVDWNAEKGAYYTLIVSDPDAPYRDNSFMKEGLGWIAVNIPGKDIASADTLVEYVGSGPPKEGGLNRFFFLLFKQPGKIQFDEKPVNKYTIEGRANFSTKKFAEKYNLGNPVGLNFYGSYYDDSVPELYRQLNCLEFLSK